MNVLVNEDVASVTTWDTFKSWFIGFFHSLIFRVYWAPIMCQAMFLVLGLWPKPKLDVVSAFWNPETSPREPRLFFNPTKEEEAYFFQFCHFVISWSDTYLLFLSVLFLWPPFLQWDSLRQPSNPGQSTALSVSPLNVSSDAWQWGCFLFSFLFLLIFGGHDRTLGSLPQWHCLMPFFVKMIIYFSPSGCHISCFFVGIFSRPLMRSLIKSPASWEKLALLHGSFQRFSS